jgi:hypothetical protein
VRLSGLFVFESLASGFPRCDFFLFLVEPLADVTFATPEAFSPDLLAEERDKLLEELPAVAIRCLCDDWEDWERCLVAEYSAGKQ